VEGAPALVDLAGRLDARFTFFVLAGRAILRRRVVRTLTGRGSRSTADVLPVTAKLGWSGALKTLVWNPRVGAAHRDMVAHLAEHGQEVGLHGGRNHADWEEHAGAWTRERAGEEIAWGLRELRGAGVDPAGFASPAWMSTPAIESCVASLGFRYIADDHGPGPFLGVGALPRIRTAIAVEPGGVGYLEWARARKLTDRELRADFLGRLRDAGPRAVAYDHPFWAGTSDLARVDLLVDAARAEGYAIVPMIESLE
jgi:hypothetical protein